MKHIAVLGANGHLGSAIAQAFYAAGYQVTAINRQGKPDKNQRSAAPQHPFNYRAADALNLPQLKRAVAGADFVFNGLNPPYREWLHTALPLARHVMSAARSAGAVHLFPGNLYNYGKHISAHCNAHTPFVPNTTPARIRIETEKLFALAAQKNQLQTLIIRSGDAYGSPLKGGWFNQTLLHKLDQGYFVYPGPVDVVHSWAYLPDLAQAFVTLAAQHQQLGQFEQYLFPGHTLTGLQIQQTLEQASGYPLKTLGFPWKLIKAGRFLVPIWREINESAYLWFRPHQLDGAALFEVTGDLALTEVGVAIQQARAAMYVN